MRLLVLMATILALSACTKNGPEERLLLLDPSTMAKARKEYVTEPAALSLPVQKVIAEANRALQEPFLSVMDKEEMPPSGNKHDYMSLGPYWWPDPTKPNGLPYIRKDGEVNPEAQSYGDNRRMGQMVDRVQTLALAFYITDGATFAAHAVQQVKRWFIDPATRMNPNLNYGQAIKGVVEGRGIGIIETYKFRYLLDALTLLSSAKEWTPAVDSGMDAWLSSYLEWLLESRHGKDEAGWKNNHGTAYDVQISCISLYLGKEELARRVIGEVLQRRIATQVESDGSQPFELERTKSWGYSNMNAAALVELAHLGQKVGVDLWNASTEDGRSIRAAVLFLIPYALGEKEWSWPLLVPLDPDRLYYSVSMSAEQFKDPVFLRAARHASIVGGPNTIQMFFVPQN